MTELFTAKTVDEAKAMAVKKFGRKASEIKFEVINEGKKGFLGLGAVDAQVKATVADAPKAVKVETPVVEKKPAAAPAPVAAEVKPVEAPAPVAAEVKPVEAPAPVAAEVKPVEAPAPVAAEVKPAEAPAPVAAEVKPAEAPAKEDDMEFSLDDFTHIEDEALMNPKVKIARDYIISIFNAMGIDATYVIYQNETGAVIDIKSDNNGTIIGRRGETLDSIQYLCSIIANKGDKDYFRITIDCLGYRSKRKETLEQLAAKVAKSVLRTGRSQQLEPMNPYERRVIHSAVSEIEGVASRSIGEEPYRKIIISSTNPRNNRNNVRGRGGNRRDDRRGRQGGRDSRRENFEAKAIDLSTSFEKDYKKPKPEDSMEGGLYGKIEF
ncbi:MAG: Jag N-terminal domain-containing protein [Ruminococcus sp.]|nr:Jag N-terminal domain-containing protein [Ruminococcus sp.]